MALIKDDYDLSGGAAFSDDVESPNNWRITVTPSNCPKEQVFEIQLWVAGEDDSFAPLVDENDAQIKRKVYGNVVTSLNVYGVNATTGKVKIIPPEGAEGTVDIDSINS